MTTPYSRYAHQLSEREHQVLYWMSHGRSNATIGKTLHLSEDTVKTHARHLFKKLGAHDRAHAVRRGFETGLLHGGQPAPKLPPYGQRVEPGAVLVDTLVGLGWTPPLRVMSPRAAS